MMKMDKKYIVLLLFLSFLNVAFSQFRLEFESFEEVPTDLSARKNLKIDANGDPAALLRVQIPMLRDVTISSPIKLGTENYSPDEFSVYLGEGSRKVTVRHPDFEPFEYTFDTPLKGKNVYKLVLRVPNDYLSLGQISVKFTTNVLNAKLEIDGKIYNTENGEFTLKLKAGEYPYTLSTTKPGYNSLEGTLSITDKEVKNSGRIDKYLELQSDKKSNLHITSAENSKIKVDGKEIKGNKGVISLPLGRHYVDVNLLGYNKTFTVDLVNDNEHLNADIRVPLTIVSPSIAEFTIKPVGDALKPSLNKFKAGQTVYLLGHYNITANAKGYDSNDFEVTVTPEQPEIKMTVPMTSTAHKLFSGMGNTKQDVKKSYKEYRKLMAKDDEVAMWEYGNILVSSGDIQQGNTYIRRAADKHHPQAAIYTAKKIVNNNPAEMKKYLEIALNGGDQSAHEGLGDVYSKMNPKDMGKAFQEYSLSTSPYSMIRRAEIAINTPSLNNVNPADIKDLLESIKPTNSYYSSALSLLGDMAHKGYGMKQNDDLAIEYWTKSNPHDLSQDALHIMAAKSLDHIEVNKDKFNLYLNEIDWNKLQDNIVYNGKNFAHYLVKAGYALDKHQTKDAFRLLSLAYKLGDRSSVTLSHLGKYYKEGKVTSKDTKTAKEYLKVCIERYNDARSMRWLGNIYEEDGDDAMAERYYKQAITNGDEASKGYYATLLYKKGKKNYPEAVKLWTQAAEAGHQQSMKNLITYYEKVAKDGSKANYWRVRLEKVKKSKKVDND